MDRLGLGLVGLNFGRSILEQVRNGKGAPFFDVVALCDQDPAAFAKLEGIGGLPHHDDLDALLADPRVAVVGLFTGPSGRADLVRRILRAGKDVMTTKPFELDPDRALAVLREAEALGRVVHLNSPAAKLPPDLAQIVDWVARYDLGRPVACRADVWCSYREVPDGTWYDDPETCPLAPVFRLGIYLINDLVRLFGPAEEVQVLSSRLFTGRPTPDNAQLGIRFRNGALANVFASFCVNDGQPYKHALTLNYENGTITRNVEPAGPAAGDAPHGLTLVAGGAADAQTLVRATPEWFSGDYDWESFHDAVRRNPGAAATPTEAVVEGIRVVRAMKKAALSGRSEPVERSAI